jgi:hypothetical protein
MTQSIISPNSLIAKYSSLQQALIGESGFAEKSAERMGYGKSSTKRLAYDEQQTIISRWNEEIEKLREEYKFQIRMKEKQKL